MTNRTTLEALLARVLEGEGPDRELDAEIAVALYGGEILWKTANWTMESYPIRRVTSKAHVGGFANVGIPLYTESLEAVLALIPKGWGWCVFSADPVQCSSPGAVLYDITYVPPDDKYEYDRPTIDASATTTVRALLAVCIKARLYRL